MSDRNHDPAAVQTRLWDEIEKHNIGMLGVVGGEPRHFQPMTAFLERATNRFWFYTYKDAHLTESVADSGAEAMFVYQLRDIQASIAGRLSLDHDRDRIDRYWNAVVAAWYPQGKDDPLLTMLRLDAADAEVWVSKAGPTRFAWKVAKANATGTTPHVGDRTHLNLH
jgi:general stress protein 26